MIVAAEAADARDLSSVDDSGRVDAYICFISASENESDMAIICDTKQEKQKREKRGKAHAHTLKQLLFPLLCHL